MPLAGHVHPIAVRRDRHDQNQQHPSQHRSTVARPRLPPSRLGRRGPPAPDRARSGRSGGDRAGPPGGAPALRPHRSDRGCPAGRLRAARLSGLRSPLRGARPQGEGHRGGDGLRARLDAGASVRRAVVRSHPRAGDAGVGPRHGAGVGPDGSAPPRAGAPPGAQGDPAGADALHARQDHGGQAGRRQARRPRAKGSRQGGGAEDGRPVIDNPRRTRRAARASRPACSAGLRVLCRRAAAG